MSGLFVHGVDVEFVGRERKRVKRWYIVSFSALVVVKQLYNNGM